MNAHKIEVRRFAIDKALAIAGVNQVGSARVDADKVVEDAKKIEAYILGEQVSTTQA